MILRMDHNTLRSAGLAAAVALSGIFISGCDGTQSGNQALEKALAQTGGTKDQTGRVAGKVTIDGEPPPPIPITIVMLYNPKKSADVKRPPIYALVNADGSFEFSTYEKGDGVPVGSYVFLFARLNRELMGKGGYHPPDGLKNLYNDPDKNAEDPEFKIDVTSAGKTDYVFDLKVADRDPVKKPGPHAITDIIH